MKRLASIIIVICPLLMLSGCYSATNDVLENNAQSQVSIRNMQSRTFDATNKKMLLRTVIATLQDLDFVIDKADETLGTITATKFTRNTPLTMTVSVRSKGATQMIVRSNARYGLKSVEQPKAYQDFFSSLSKALFLDAHQV